MEIDIKNVTRMEGHANVLIEAEGDKIKTARFMPNEGRRYFEALLKGRYYYDAPITTSRICGVCSEAHLLTSLEALEHALGVQSTPQVKLLRKIMLIASIIESHALHVYALALPDYLGYESVLSMAENPDLAPVVKEALNVKKFTNTILTAIGGRNTHPVTFMVGGVTNLPKPSALEMVLNRLKSEAIPFAEKTFNLVAGLDFPDFNNPEHEFIAVTHPDEYGVQGTELKSSKGENININEKAAEYFVETEDPYSSNNVTATPLAETVVCNALARVNLNYNQLNSKTKELVENSKWAGKFPSNNSFLNVLAQAIEIHHFCEYTANVLDGLKLKDEPRAVVKPQAGRGICMQEVPRGTIMHEYVTDAVGKIERARVMAPTTFFTKSMDADMKVLAQNLLDQNVEKPEFVKQVEMLVRAYDPCISCSTHTLKVDFRQL